MRIRIRCGGIRMDVRRSLVRLAVRVRTTLDQVTNILLAVVKHYADTIKC